MSENMRFFSIYIYGYISLDALNARNYFILVIYRMLKKSK